MMKIVNFILCDEVRREDNGKFILIGVYPHNIKLNLFPHAMTLTMWVQLMSGTTNQIQIEFRVIDENHDVKLSGSGSVGVDDIALPATVPIGAFPVEFMKPGKLIFQIRETGKRWQTMSTIAVEKSDS